MKRWVLLLFLIINQIAIAQHNCMEDVKYCYDIDMPPGMAIVGNQSKDEVFLQKYCSILFKKGCNEYQIQIKKRKVQLDNNSITIKEACEKILESCQKKQE